MHRQMCLSDAHLVTLLENETVCKRTKPWSFDYGLNMDGPFYIAIYFSHTRYQGPLAPLSALFLL